MMIKIYYTVMAFLSLYLAFRSIMIDEHRLHCIFLSIATVGDINIVSVFGNSQMKKKDKYVELLIWFVKRSATVTITYPYVYQDKYCKMFHGNSMHNHLFDFTIVYFLITNVSCMFPMLFCCMYLYCKEK